jgi:hypothetical protein
MTDRTFKKPKQKKRRLSSSADEAGKKTRIDDAIEKIADTTTPMTLDSPPAPPALTKRGSLENLTGTATLEATHKPTFKIAKRPGLAEVKLLPHIVTKLGTIAGISFGRNRTPSPFGNRMGDHTGSWTTSTPACTGRI